MIIKTERSHLHLLWAALRTRGNRRPFKLPVVVLAGSVCLLMFFLMGAFAERMGLSRKAHKASQLNAANVAGNYLSSLSARPDRLTIDIKHKYYRQLATWRHLALERDQITSDLKDYVPATIHYDGKLHPAKIRLKGEWVDHLTTDKWSFRVKLKGDGRLFGMRQFSLQHPQTRSYINEWIYQRALARAGVPALRYRFVDVTVNGRDLGVFALEEHFGKELIEHNQRRQGVILRFDARFFYQPFRFDAGVEKVREPGALKTLVDGGIASEHAAEITAYDQEKFAEDVALENQYRTACQLLEAFRVGQLPTSEVFDVSCLARYFAVSELLGAVGTADDWSDMRFLYNPVTSRLEPIGVEGGSYEVIESLMGTRHTSQPDGRPTFHRYIFRDPVFFAEYLAALEEVSDPSYLARLLDEIGPEMQKQLKILYHEWPYKEPALDVFKKNAEIIRSTLNPTQGLHAYLVQCDGESCRVELGAIQPLPLEVLSLTRGAAELHPERHTVLPGMPPLQPVPYQTLNFTGSVPDPDDESVADVWTVHYRLLGTSQELTSTVFPRPRLDREILDSDLLRAAPNCHEFPFVVMDDAEQTITLQPGVWRLERDMVIPPGYLVMAGPGVHLDLGEAATIVSYSPLSFRGTEETPVVVESSDGTGQGIAVLRAGGPSVLQDAVFRNLAPPQHGGWELTGAITFYESPVRFDRCEFNGCRAEDGLNVIRTDFTMSRCVFLNATSDAFDGDFVTGEIRDSVFTDVAGDGFDVSGSKVEVRHSRFTRIADKALSVGEGSHLSGREISVADSRIGVASKDLSSAELYEMRIADCEMGLVAFCKKPEYGPAQLAAHDLLLQKVKKNFVVEEGSVLTVDERTIPPNHKGVKQLIYGTEGK